jgi:tetratricopeptide (TPR) repeat protein
MRFSGTAPAKAGYTGRMKNTGMRAKQKNQDGTPEKSALNVSKEKKHTGVMLTAIILATIIVYWNSLGNGFVKWDDDKYVSSNEDIRQLDGASVLKYFTTYYLKMYQPLAMISYACDYRIGKLNALTYHCTNCILHLLNAVLVFYLILLLTKQTGIAAICALFFSIHPLHVESVAWISERKDLLYSLFYLGSLIAYVFYRKKNDNLKFYFLTILFYLLSLFSKSAAVTLPLILVLTDYYLDKKLTFKNNLDKIPFFLLSVVFGLVSLLSQRVIGNDLDYVTGYTLLDRFFMGAYALTFYIIRSILPFGLSAVHPLPLKPNGVLPIKYYISGLTFIGFVWILIKVFRSRADESLKKDIVYGMLFFLATISLVIFIPVGQAVVAERYTYIPYIGLFMILGRLYVHSGQRRYSFSPKLRHGYTALIGVMAVLFAYSAYGRTALWGDTFSLFSDAISKYPEAGLAYNNRGNVRKDRNDFKGALEDYNKAIELNYGDAYNNRGILRTRMHDYKDAIEDFDKALNSKSSKEKAYYNRGIAKLNLGDFNGAVADFGKAIEIDPHYSDAYNNRGFVRYEKLEDFAGAVRDFDAAISLSPKAPDLYYNRGNAKMLAGNYESAASDYDTALQIKPDYREAYFNRGIALLNLKRTDRACLSWRKALELGAAPAAKLIQTYCK